MTSQTKSIADRLKKLWEFDAVEAPAFPKKILAEISNRCNHACVFCAHRRMNRALRDMDPAFYERVAREAWDLGAREIGLHMGAEPFASRHLELCVGLAKQIGYDYIYLSTNGTLATPERLKTAIDNGLHSIKFSVNGGNREAYKRIHGVDHFNKVLDHVRFAAEYRRQTDKEVYLSVSFISCQENADSYDDLVAALGGLVDEICKFPVRNQSGQVPNAKATSRSTCHAPFSTVHITAEGYLRVCCNDYHNYTAIADLNTTTLAAAWNSAEFIEFRQRFLSGKIEGTLCHNCLRNRHDQIFPLNKSLCPHEMI